MANKTPNSKKPSPGQLVSPGFSKKRRLGCRGAIFAIFVVVAAGCSSRTPSGVFVAQDSNEVDVLDVAEVPAGSIGGTITRWTIDGDQRKSTVLNVSGSISKGELLLHIGFPSFVGSTNVVGTASSSEIDLSFGGNTVVFKKVTNDEYAKVLASFDQRIADIRSKRVAEESAAKSRQLIEDALDRERQNAANGSDKVLEQISKLEEGLSFYLKWGNERISRAKLPFEWYADRISKYQKCVDTVTRLSDRGVPSWQWQACVIDMDNDNYSRSQFLAALNQKKNENAAFENNLDAAIRSLPGQVSNAVGDWTRFCEKTNDKSCDHVSELKNAANSQSLNSLITQYRELAQKVNSSIDSWDKVKDDSDSKLADLQRQADNIYHRASYSGR